MNSLNTIYYHLYYLFSQKDILCKVFQLPLLFVIPCPDRSAIELRSALRDQKTFSLSFF